MLHGLRRDRTNAVRPSVDIFDRLPGGERGAVPTRQSRLVILGIDGVGDQPSFGAVEFIAADALGNQLGEDAKLTPWAISSASMPSIAASSRDSEIPGFGTPKTANFA